MECTGKRNIIDVVSRSLGERTSLAPAGHAAIHELRIALQADIRSEAEAIIDYVKICDPETLEDVSVIDRPVRMALAVRVGRSRLIDNMALVPPNPPRSVQGETS